MAAPKKTRQIKDNGFLVYLSATAILLITTTLLSVQPVEQTQQAAGISVKTTPVLKEQAGTLRLSANAVYAVDIETGSPLFAKNAREPLLPASTTKIATGLVSLAHYRLDDVLTVGKVDVVGQKMGLVEGEKISVHNLIYGLLVSSANDAAEVLARNYPGGRENFVVAMNQVSRSAGLKNSHFTNPVGFDEYLHFSTAEDLVKLASFAIQNPTFAQMVATPKLNVSSLDGKVHELVNINQLLGRVPGVLGVKTGWSLNSGESLVALVERDGKRIMISVLGSSDRFGETEKLIEWIFENYSWD